MMIAISNLKVICLANYEVIKMTFPLIIFSRVANKRDRQISDEW